MVKWRIAHDSVNEIKWLEVTLLEVSKKEEGVVALHLHTGLEPVLRCPLAHDLATAPSGLVHVWTKWNGEVTDCTRLS